MALNYGYVAGPVIVYLLLQLLVHYTHDRREPKPVATTLPFISPIIGMMRKKLNYYVELRDSSKLPIYTLRMPFARLYIVNSPGLISAVQKQPKTLAFWPLAVKGSANVGRFSRATMEIISTDDVNGNDYGHGFHDAIQPPLAPGEDLDAMNRTMLGLVAASLNGLRTQHNTQLRLFSWVTSQITIATTGAAYGPGNPWRDPAFETAFWTYKDGMGKLIMNVLPTLTAKDAIAAMEFGSSAFERYFKDGHHLKGSALVRARFAHSSKHSLCINDIGRAEFTNGVALLSNTVPNTFWMLYHVYSNPAILAECRAELRAIISNDAKRTVDMSKVKSECPVLLSTYKEVLRTYSTAVTARLVTEDHLLDGQYLLKKGGTILMPSPVQHLSDVWGDDKDAFNHKRFTRTGSQRTNPASFRAFGGGTTLCPGRHFATTEILAFVAVTILQFDIRPVSGQWMPPATTVEFWEATKGPASDFDVEMRPVGEFDKGEDWTFTLSGSDRPIELSAEDLQ